MAHAETLVGGVDDERVCRHWLVSFERESDELADTFINGGNAFIHLMHPFVVAPLPFALAEFFAAFAGDGIAIFTA